MSFDRNPITNQRAQSRRAFVMRAGAVVGGLGLLVRRAGAQEQQASTTNGGEEMTSDSYKPVSRPPKPGATPSMSKVELETFERQLACPCPCTLDIYTCRTTDFTCQVSPAMHRDVMRLIAGGYEAEEILEAFVSTYGEVALTAPKKEGFNWAGYLAPGIAMATGAVALTILLRKWAREARTSAAARSAGGLGAAALPGVSAEELSRLDRALREEG